MGDGDRRTNDGRDALERLYELVRDGLTDTTEFAQLDHLVHQRMLQAYARRGDSPV